MNKLNCPICYCRLNEFENIPLTFKNCGHSCCKLCLQELIKPMANKKKASISCPFCRTKQTFKGNLTTIEDEFPRNYLVLAGFELPTEKKTAQKVYESILTNFVCFDQNCKSSEKNNMFSEKVQHANCQSEFIINFDHFDSKLEFLTPNFIIDFNPDELKNKVKRQLKQFENCVFSIIDACNEKVREEVNFLEKAKQDYGFFLDKKYLFNFEKMPQTNKLKISLKNQDKIEQFMKKNAFEFGLLFEEKIRELSHYHLTSTITGNANIFERFEANLFVTNQDLIAKMKEINWQILNNLLLKDWKPDIPFSFESSFESIRNHLCGFKSNFKVVESNNFSERLQISVRKAIFKAFHQSKITYKTVENIISKEMNNGLEKESWKTSFNFDVFPIYDKHVSSFSTFECEKFYLSIFRNDQI